MCGAVVEWRLSDVMYFRDDKLRHDIFVWKFRYASAADNVEIGVWLSGGSMAIFPSGAMPIFHKYLTSREFLYHVHFWVDCGGVSDVGDAVMDWVMVWWWC